MFFSKTSVKTLSILLLITCFFTFNVVPVFAAISYTYDADGNMTSDGTNCFVYNEDNKMTQVKNCGTNQVIAEYIYDYQGNRVEEKEYTNGTLTATIYNPTDDYETKKLADNSIQNKTYYHANGQIIARKNPDGSKTYYQNDHLGSTSLLTNQSGSIVENTTYYPYGQVRSGGTQSKYLFTGKQNDTETGLTYFGARYYDSHIQRFAQPDTFKQDVYRPQALNGYSYVLNNPLIYIDPSGHFYEILAYNNALNSYYSKPSVTSYNNVLSSIVSIQKSSNSTSSSSSGGGSKSGASSGSGSTNSTSLAKDSSQAVDLYKPLYNYLLGDDLKTFSNPKASLAQRGLAGIGLVGSVDLPEIKGLKIFKGVTKNLYGGEASVKNILTGAEDWLGPGYKEIDNGVFRSADGSRQFRMEEGSLKDARNGPHVSFESVAPDGRGIIENTHVKVLDP